MSKFEEMCKTFADARDTWIGYKDRCWQYITTLSTGFVKYCDIPQGHFAFVPVRNAEPEKKYTPPDAIQFESDGYFHVGWRITLCESPNTFPHQSVLVALALRESEQGKVMIKRGWEQEAQEIDLKNESQRQAFYNGVVQRIKEYFGRNPEDMGSDSRSSKIGFQVL
jgi:hypothetical protein